MAQRAKVRPTYQTGKDSVDVKVGDFLKAVEMMSQHGKYEDFKSMVSDKKVNVSVPPKTLNAIKKFVKDNNMHTDELGARIVNPRTDSPDPYDCDF